MDTFQFFLPLKNLGSALQFLSENLQHTDFEYPSSLKFGESTIVFDGVRYIFPTQISEQTNQVSVEWNGYGEQGDATIDTCLWVGAGNVVAKSPVPRSTKQQQTYDLLHFKIRCELGKKHCLLGLDIYHGQCSGLLEEDSCFQQMEHGLADLSKFEIVGYDMVGDVMIKPAGKSDSYSEWLDQNDYDHPAVDKMVESLKTFFAKA